MGGARLRRGRLAMPDRQRAAALHRRRDGHRRLVAARCAKHRSRRARNDAHVESAAAASTRTSQRRARDRPRRRRLTRSSTAASPCCRPPAWTCAACASSPAPPRYRGSAAGTLFCCRLPITAREEPSRLPMSFSGNGSRYRGAVRLVAMVRDGAFAPPHHDGLAEALQGDVILRSALLRASRRMRHTHLLVLATCFVRGFQFRSRSLQTEGAGKTGCALHPRSRVH